MDNGWMDGCYLKFDKKFLSKLVHAMTLILMLCHSCNWEWHHWQHYYLVCTVKLYSVLICTIDYIGRTGQTPYDIISSTHFSEEFSEEFFWGLVMCCAMLQMGGISKAGTCPPCVSHSLLFYLDLQGNLEGSRSNQAQLPAPSAGRHPHRDRFSCHFSGDIRNGSCI